MSDINNETEHVINLNDNNVSDDIMKYIERLYKNKKEKGVKQLPMDHEKMRKKKRRMQKQARKK